MRMPKGIESPRGIGKVQTGIEKVMTLAVILGMCALLAPPPASAYSQPALTAQAAPAPQDTPPSSPPPSEPPSGAQQEPSSPAPEQAKPAESGSPQSAPAQSAAQQPESSQTAETGSQPQSKPTPAKKSKKKGKKTKAATQASGGPTRTVVRNGSTAEPQMQLSAGGSQEQASRQRQNTLRLLQITETNLRKISVRQLNSGQQDTVKQIRTYMDQAKAAADSGDLPRAHNLAFKAHLLCDELLKQ